MFHRFAIWESSRESQQFIEFNSFGLKSGQAVRACGVVKVISRQTKDTQTKDPQYNVETCIWYYKHWYSYISVTCAFMSATITELLLTQHLATMKCPTLTLRRKLWVASR